MIFRPKIIDTLKGYDRDQFIKDLWAGVIVGIVALPLAIAFAIASGVSPEKGLFTAVIAGFIISVLGGSRVQIGGPTGAFIVIVYGIVQQYGVNGLIIATFMAGIMLMVMGLVGLGTLFKFIPYPLVVGFTSGIALIIFSSQLNDLFGWNIEKLPGEFVDKWKIYLQSAGSINGYAVLLAATTIAIILFWPKITMKVPGSLVAIILTTVAAQTLQLPVSTIGSRFGNIASALPAAVVPSLDFTTIQHLFAPAFAIALLGGIESLLSAMVADGMIGGNHRSNTELIAQGTANIFSPLFGGIPATGAIARTATNIKNGGRSPIAGIVHALTLLLIILFVGKWASMVPLATLAGILIVVAYHMSEWKSFVSVLKGPRADMAVLVTTFLLTVLIDLIVAIEIGMVLAAFLFMRIMIRFTDVRLLTGPLEDLESSHDRESINNFAIPAGVEVFEITGPLFFGATYKFKDAIRLIEKPPRILIIRMRRVPMIDATGLRVLSEVYKESKHRGTKLIISEVYSNQVMEELKDSRLLFAIGKANVIGTIEKALLRCRDLLTEAETTTPQTGAVLKDKDQAESLRKKA
jgi:SulP family sulfate permease